MYVNYPGLYPVFSSLISPASDAGCFLIFSHKSLLIRLLVRCLDMLFPVRTPLHNLFAFVHPKVVSVFSKLSSQRIDGYNHFCYHIISFLFTLSIVSEFNAGPLATISRPSRTSRLRARSSFERRCKDTMKKLPSPNFFAKIFQKNAFSWIISEQNSQIHKFTQICIFVFCS